MIVVAFCACPWRLAAPGAWVCALAIPIDPSTNKAAAKVIVIFRIKSSCPVVMGGKLKHERYGTATTAGILPYSATGGDAFISAGHDLYGQSARLVHAIGTILSQRRVLAAEGAYWLQARWNNAP
jgi:hypothetical protein